MKVKGNLTLNFTEESLKEIVARYIKDNIGYEVSTEDIHFNVKTRTEGYGMSEHPVYYLEGCTAKLLTEEEIPVKAKEEPKAKWEYWTGWASNHDKRIEDATCSRCGYLHPTVRGSYVFLADECPRCHSKMIKN